jgi:hypothetical protein
MPINGRDSDPQPNTPGEAVKSGCKEVFMLLQAARPESAFLKLGIYGDAGSGKSYTSSLVAIGLSKLLKSSKPVGFVDTETGSDYLIPMFEREGVSLIRTKTRAFADLLTVIDEAKEACDVLVIDSVTHFWNELVASYKKTNKLSFMTLKHWDPLKQTWKEYTDRFVNSPLHIIVAGRSADKWDEVEDPNDGAKELKKVGTKMRVEGQFAYEPSLLVEMESVQLTARAGGKVIRRAFVKKDRFDIMDGASFDNPTFDTFMPHIAALNLGGEHKAFEEGRDSTAMFTRNDIGERKSIQKEILLEKIQNEIKKLHPGQTKEDTRAKIDLLQELFETNSWTEISTFFSNEKLAEGLNNLQLKALRAEDDMAKAEAVKAEPATPAPTNGGKSKTKGARA